MRRRTSQLGLDIVLVNVWESVNARAEAQQFCATWGIEADVLLDESADYARRLGVRGVPTNVVVDEHGIVRAVGATTPADLRAAVSGLLGTSDW